MQHNMNPQLPFQPPVPYTLVHVCPSTIDTSCPSTPGLCLIHTATSTTPLLMARLPHCCPCAALQCMLLDDAVAASHTSHSRLVRTACITPAVIASTPVPATGKWGGGFGRAAPLRPFWQESLLVTPATAAALGGNMPRAGKWQAAACCAGTSAGPPQQTLHP